MKTPKFMIECSANGCAEQVGSWIQCPVPTCGIDIGYCKQHGGQAEASTLMRKHKQKEHNTVNLGGEPGPTILRNIKPKNAEGEDREALRETMGIASVSQPHTAELLRRAYTLALDLLAANTILSPATLTDMEEAIDKGFFAKAHALLRLHQHHRHSLYKACHKLRKEPTKADELQSDVQDAVKIGDLDRANALLKAHRQQAVETPTFAEQLAQGAADAAPNRQRTPAWKYVFVKAQAETHVDAKAWRKAKRKQRKLDAKACVAEHGIHAWGRSVHREGDLWFTHIVCVRCKTLCKHKQFAQGACLQCGLTYASFSENQAVKTQRRRVKRAERAEAERAEAERMRAEAKAEAEVERAEVERAEVEQAERVVRFARQAYLEERVRAEAKAEANYAKRAEREEADHAKQAEAEAEREDAEAEAEDL